jgi:hypothetical protein
MHENIRKLAEQASILQEGCDPVGLQVEQLEKFARLIIGECTSIYSRIDNGNSHMGTDNYLKAVYRHFRD